MKYSEFIKGAEELGFKVEVGEYEHRITSAIGDQLMSVSRNYKYELEVDTDCFDTLSRDHQAKIWSLAIELSSTPLEQRLDGDLYYIHFLPENGEDESYLVRDNDDGVLFIGCKDNITNSYQTKFTKVEIIAINPDFMAFTVKIEEED